MVNPVTFWAWGRRGGVHHGGAKWWGCGKFSSCLGYGREGRPGSSHPLLEHAPTELIILSTKSLKFFFFFIMSQWCQTGEPLAFWST